MKLLILSLDQALITTQNTGDTRDRFKYYARHTDSITVLVPTQHKTKLNPAKTNPKITIIPCFGSTKTASYFRLLQRLKYILSSTNFDIIVTNDPALGALALITRGRATNPKIQINVFGLHTHNKYWIRQRWQNRLLKYIHHWALKRADSIRTDNTFDQKQLIDKHHLPPQKIFVSPIVPSPQFINSFKSARKSSSLKKSVAGNHKLVLSVGNLVANKDYPTLIHAAKIVLRKHPNTTFVIIGNGDQKPKLHHLIKKLHLTKNFKLLSSIDYNQIPQFFKSADLFVLSSYQEGLPRVLMEASLAKTPIVTTQINGVADLISNGKSGLVVPIHNPKKLASAITRLLNQPKIGRQLATNAYQKATTYLDFQASLNTLLASWRQLSPSHPNNSTHQSHLPQILFISTDSQFLNSKSPVFQRHQTLAQHFNHLDVIVLSQGYHQPISQDNLSVIPTNSVTKWLYWFDAFKITNRLSKIKVIDLVSAEDPFFTGLIALIISKLFRLQLLIQVHADFFSKPFWREENIQTRIFHRLAHYILPHASAIRTVSPTISKSLKHLIKSPTSIQSIPVFPNISKQPKSINSHYKFDLISIGRLDPQKDHLTLLKALLTLQNRHQLKPRTLILGSGKLDKKLQQFAKSHQLNHVTFKPHQSHSQTLKLLNQSKVFVSSSKYEGTSIALMEAMQLQKPIISSKVSGAQDLLTHNQSALLFPVGQFKTLADHTQSLLTNPKLQTKLAKNAKMTINHLLHSDPQTQWAKFITKVAFAPRRAQALKQLNIDHYNQGHREIEKSDSHPSKLVYNQVIRDFLSTNIPRNHSVIDIGGGAGYITSKLQSQRPDLHIVGTDISLLMTQLRRQIGLGSNFVGDMDFLPLKNKSFGTVIYIASIHHTPNTDWALSEAFRILKPGGTLLLAELNSFSFGLSLFNRRAVISPDPRECLINHRLLTHQAQNVGFKIGSVRLEKQATTIIEAFTTTAPVSLYRLAYKADKLLRLIPYYREIGALSLIKATKPK